MNYRTANGETEDSVIQEALKMWKKAAILPKSNNYFCPSKEYTPIHSVLQPIYDLFSENPNVKPLPTNRRYIFASIDSYNYPTDYRLSMSYQDSESTSEYIVFYIHYRFYH